MTRAGPGALLALWNDVEPDRDGEYERWHAIEHVPERVRVPGFIAGTRYASDASDQPRYFTLYELESLACLESSAYRALVARPTPWSVSMRPSLGAFLRKPCSLAVDQGAASGAGIVALRLVFGGASSLPTADDLDIVARMAWDGGERQFVTRIQIGEVRTTGPQALANVDEAPPGTELLVLVQTSRPECLHVMDAWLERICDRYLPTPAWTRRGRYRFASSVMHEQACRLPLPSMQPAAA